jgi:hypothetical protein
VELTGDFHERRYFPDIFETSADFSRIDEVWRFEPLSPVADATITPIHTNPTDSGFHWPPWRLGVEPLPIRVRLINETGRPYSDPAAVMEYAPRVIAATVTAGEVIRSVRLFPDPEAPGEYIGRIDGMSTGGEHQLLVELDLSYPNYTPENVPARIVFSRTDTFLTSPSTYMGLTIIMALLIAFLIWRFFAVRNNKVMGELVFLDQGQLLGSINLYSGKNWRTIKKQELDEYPQFGLKKMTVYSTPKPKLSKNDELADLTFSEQGPEVRIDYITDDGEKVRGELLDANGNLTFGGLFQVKYEASIGE